MEPIFHLYPFREDDYERRVAETETRLAPCKKEGLFTGRDVRLIHYVSYEPSAPNAIVVVCHSAGESALKYIEFASFFFDMGYKVCLFDFRGHGGSWRPLANRSVTHVQSFEGYAHDLEDCIERLARDDLPLFIFGCGMGGAVALRYLQKHPTRVAKACLLSPLVGYKLPSPEGINRLKLRSAVKRGLGREVVPGSECYQPHEVFSGSNYRSFARFSWYRAHRASDTRLQNSAVTIGWLNAMLENSDKLLQKRRNRRITTRVLICEAGNDEVLPKGALNQLRAKWQNIGDRSSKNSAALICFQEARHDLQNSETKTLGDLFKLVHEFFKG